MTSLPDFDEAEDDCPNCGGESWVDSCFEDTCLCVDPPCHRTRCGWCNPKGSTRDDKPVVQEAPAPTPAGPLLKLMGEED